MSHILASTVGACDADDSEELPQALRDATFSDLSWASSAV